MRRLFVRSGGGMPGIDMHIGYWLALEQAGIEATECIGTSAGAIVSALDASGMKASDAKIIVSRLTDKDIRKERWFWKWRSAFYINWFLSNDPIKKLFKDLLPQNGRDYKKKCRVCAMRWKDCEPVYFSTTNTSFNYRDCVLASMSIAGVFPRVKLGDEEYSDGGPRDNIPVPTYIDDYDEVWVLIASAVPDSYKGRDTIITALKRQADALMYDQPCDIVDRYASNPKVRIVWMRARTPNGALHFDHNLIEEAYHFARHEIKRWL